MKKVFVISVLASLTTSFAFAGSLQTSAQSMALTFDELKESCLNPQRFHNQIPPREITIMCNDSRVIWVPSMPLSAPVAPEQRQVKTSIASDKYQVNENQNQVPLNAKASPCTNFKEIRQIYGIQKKVTCEELVKFQGNLLDYCLGQLDSGLQENPDLLSETPTGRGYSMCQGQVMQQQAFYGNKVPLAGKTPVNGSQDPEKNSVRRVVSRR